MCAIKYILGPLLISPVDRAGLRWENVKDPGDEFWCQIRETKQTWRNTKILTFGPILASVTLKAVSLQLNGMLMMWKTQQAMQDDNIQTARIHPAFHPGNRDEVSIGQNFQPAYRDLRNRASLPSHMNTSKILQRIQKWGKILETGLIWRGPWSNEEEASTW